MSRGGGVGGDCAALFETSAEGIEIFTFDGGAWAGLTERADPVIEFERAESDEAQGTGDQDKGQEEDGEYNEDQESENETNEQATTRWRGGVT